MILRKLQRLTKIKDNTYKYRVEYKDKHAALDRYMHNFPNDLRVGGYYVKYYIPFERKLIDALMKIVPEFIRDFCRHRRDFRRSIDERNVSEDIKLYSEELEQIESELNFSTMRMIMHLQS